MITSTGYSDCKEHKVLIHLFDNFDLLDVAMSYLFARYKKGNSVNCKIIN